MPLPELLQTLKNEIMSYIIKNNLPKGIIKETGRFRNRTVVAQYFSGLYNHLITNFYSATIFLRNESDKELRGTIKVEIDGFYYYIELFKED